MIANLVDHKKTKINDYLRIIIDSIPSNILIMMDGGTVDFLRVFNATIHNVNITDYDVKISFPNLWPSYYRAKGSHHAYRLLHR